MTGVLHIAVHLISPHLLSKTSILLFRGLYVLPMLDTVVNLLLKRSNIGRRLLSRVKVIASTNAIRASQLGVVCT